MEIDSAIRQAQQGVGWRKKILTRRVPYAKCLPRFTVCTWAISPVFKCRRGAFPSAVFFCGAHGAVDETLHVVSQHPQCVTSSVRWSGLQGNLRKNAFTVRQPSRRTVGWLFRKGGPCEK